MKGKGCKWKRMDRGSKLKGRGREERKKDESLLYNFPVKLRGDGQEFRERFREEDFSSLSLSS